MCILLRCSMADSIALTKPAKQFQSKITDLLLNVDSEHIKNNAQNIVSILSLFSEINQVWLLWVYCLILMCCCFYTALFQFWPFSPMILFFPRTPSWRWSCTRRKWLWWTNPLGVWHSAICRFGPNWIRSNSIPTPPSLMTWSGTLRFFERDSVVALGYGKFDFLTCYITNGNEDGHPFVCLRRFIFLNSPNLRHIELKAMPGEIRGHYPRIDVLSYLPRVKKLKFAYLQVIYPHHRYLLQHFCLNSCCT